jgi:hypothetical protein
MNLLPESRIKNELMGVIKSGKDLKISQNFFDIHPEKDKIFFVQDRKAQEILGQESLKYQVNQTHRRLTLNKDSDGNYKNQAIFDELGFDPETMNYVKPLKKHLVKYTHFLSSMATTILFMIKKR